jgi:hypothetical protein
MFKEELVEQAKPGIDWRLGAGGPTIMETTAAVVHVDGVIFPGTYTLTARCRDESRWDLRFVEGQQPARRGPPGEDKGPQLPALPLARTLLEKPQDHTKKLEIDIDRVSDKDKAKLGWAGFQVRFGPHQLASDFLCVGTDKKRGKVGKTGVEIEFLKYPLTQEFEDVLLGKGERSLTVAQVKVPKDEASTLVILDPAEVPILRLPGFNRSFTGKRSTGSSKATRLDLQLKAKLIIVRLGTTNLEFEIGEDAFTKVETGAATPSKNDDGNE